MLPGIRPQVLDKSARVTAIGAKSGFQRLTLAMAASKSTSVVQSASTKQVSFEILAIDRTSRDGARLGRLTCLGRRDFETPSHFALSSRGAVPHLSQYNLRDWTNVLGVHNALEDCEYLYQPSLLH